MSEISKYLLIIDDELFVRQSLVDFFEDNVWHVSQAESGEKALEVLKNTHINSAIVDVRMKSMDGDTFIREAHKQYPDMVFIVCTGSPEYELPEDLAGICNVSNNVFSKPVMDLHVLENELLHLIEINTN